MSKTARIVTDAEIDAHNEAMEAAEWEASQAQVRWAERGGYAAGLPRPVEARAERSALEAKFLFRSRTPL